MTFVRTLTLSHHQMSRMGGQAHITRLYGLCAELFGMSLSV